MNDVPSTWSTPLLNKVAVMGTGHTPSRSIEEYWRNCHIPWVTVSDLGRLDDSTTTIYDTVQTISEVGLNNSAAVLHPAGTVALSRTASVGYSVIMGVPMAVTQGFVTWTCGPTVDPRYLLHQLRAMRPFLDSISHGSTHRTIFFPDVKAIKIALPPALHEQRRIADFLDTETARIDALIEAKKGLVSTLRERFLSAVTEATWGSGRSTRLKHHVEILPGLAFPSAGYIHGDDDSGVRLLRGVNVGIGVVRWEEVVRWPLGDVDALKTYELAENDVVLGLDRPWIKGGIRAACISATDLPALLLQRVARLRGRSSLDPRFMYYLLRSKKFLAHFEPEMTGISVPHISTDQVGDFVFPHQSGEEQRKVAYQLDSMEVAHQRAVSLLEDQIDCIAEHRQALITAAVTGQLDESTLNGHRWIDDDVPMEVQR